MKFDRFGPRRLAPLCATGVAVLCVSACGSGANSNSAGSARPSAAASSGDLAALRATVDAHTSASRIGPTVPIGKAVPAGKHLVYVNCGQPACLLVDSSLTAAAKVLGWSVTTINAQPTPPGPGSPATR